jgi:hypothetical protein
MTALARLGGEAGCRRLAQEFYRRVAGSEELKPLFPGKSLRCATEEFSAFLIQFLDGDPAQTQYRWWLSLRESHARFEITELQRSAWLGLMQEAITAVIADATTRNQVAQFFGVTSRYVIGSEENSEIADPELRVRWSAQRTLDHLTACIAAGNDDEAVELAAGFANRPAVFVGILAEMMEAGRDRLDDFVLERVVTDPSLSGVFYNTRSLLHFAAGHACLPVTERALKNGVDPNLRDAGGHTPLYRVNPGRNNSGPRVVEALVAAGADVNDAGGVTQSTALHQAARFGFVSVARALLAAGADVSRRDKKGFTPLDRARNCRRSELVALLENYSR